MIEHIEFTDRELGLIALAIIKCDIMSDWKQLPQPWCDDHDDSETDWLLLKIAKMKGEI